MNLLKLKKTDTMKKTKDQVQVEAVEAIKRNNGRGIIAMATGTGKSKVAIDYTAEKQKDNFDLRVLIVVPTEKLRDINWKEEFHKWGQDFLWNNNVERSCYASISKLEGEYYDIVFLDEGHNITELNSTFFEQNTVGDLIMLTATPPRKQEKVDIIDNLKLEIIYEVTLDEAVEWGLVSPYKITVVYTTLDISRKYVKAGNKDKVFYQTEFSSYAYLTSAINITPTRTSKHKALVMKRMRLIYNALSKTDVAKFLIEKVIPREQRTLIFAGTIEQAEILCQDSVHSKTNDSRYHAFRNEEINLLSSVRVLNQGENIPNLDNAVIVQLNSNELDMVQRIGRTVRYRDGHLANIYIIILKDTVDLNWLMSAISEFDRNNIEYVDFGEIKMRYT